MVHLTLKFTVTRDDLGQQRTVYSKLDLPNWRGDHIHRVDEDKTIRTVVRSEDDGLVPIEHTVPKGLYIVDGMTLEVPGVIQIAPRTLRRATTSGDGNWMLYEEYDLPEENELDRQYNKTLEPAGRPLRPSQVDNGVGDMLARMLNEEPAPPGRRIVRTTPSQDELRREYGSRAFRPA